MLSSYALASTRALRFQSNLSFRNFTTTVSRSLKPKRKPSPSISPSSNVTVERGQSQRLNALATKILEAGRNDLYINSASGAFVATCWSVVIMSYGSIGYLYSTKLWDEDTAKGRGLSWYVPLAYKATMVCWGVLAAYAFSRTLGLVKSIRLVKNADKTFIEAYVRRPVPFMRPEKVIADPSTLIINRGKLYGSVYSEGMITAPEGDSVVTKLTRALFYSPFHNVRKSLGGVGLVPITVGPDGSKRHLMLDADGQFSNGGQDLLDISQDE